MALQEIKVHTVMRSKIHKATITVECMKSFPVKGKHSGG